MKGPEAAAEIQNIRQRLLDIADEVSTTFPVSFQDSRALLNGLRQRGLKLRDAESQAVRALESAIGAFPAKDVQRTAESEQQHDQHRSFVSVSR